MLTDVDTQSSSIIILFPTSLSCEHSHMPLYSYYWSTPGDLSHCVQCPVECLTELPGWLDPSPLLILIHPKVTSDHDSNYTGSSPLLADNLTHSV